MSKEKKDVMWKVFVRGWVVFTPVLVSSLFFWYSNKTIETDKRLVAHESAARMFFGEHDKRHARLDKTIDKLDKTIGKLILRVR